ncbi:MAG: flagellar protein FlgN [Schlesneria sp.]|nr:flagellar protein FlgN [Schlesneria sp.]
MNATQISNELAERMQRHLTEEEQSLVTVLDAVRAVHDSLRNLDGNALADALDSEAAALRKAEGVQVRRQQIRVEAAGALGVPPQDVTLSVFAEKTTGPLQTTVVESRQKLAQMSTEMERLNRQNSAMLQQSLSLIRGIVGRLTGTAPGETYGAGGAREETHVGSLMQWGG